MTQVDAVRRRLVEAEHRTWIDVLHRRTGWPRTDIVDMLLCAHGNRQRLHDAFEQFQTFDNLNPFTLPPPSQRFLRFLQT